jgi:hypothetical protein
LALQVGRGQVEVDEDVCGVEAGTCADDHDLRMPSFVSFRGQIVVPEGEKSRRVEAEKNFQKNLRRCALT